jgi:hypothetical protein
MSRARALHGRGAVTAAATALIFGACGGATPAPATAPVSEPTRVAAPPAPAQPAPTQAATSNPNKQPPTLGPVKALTVPAVNERRLANGLRILIVEHHELPLVDLLLIVRSGSEAEAPAEAGLATLVANMLDEGAGGRSALAIAEQISFLGIGLGTAAGWDQSRVSLHTPVAQMDSALALMADVALRPSFPANEFDRLKKERLTALLQQRDRGPAIADVAFSHVLFGTSTRTATRSSATRRRSARSRWATCSPSTRRTSDPTTRPSWWWATCGPTTSRAGSSAGSAAGRPERSRPRASRARPRRRR